VSYDEYEVRITARAKFPASAREAEMLVLKLRSAMAKLESLAPRKWDVQLRVKVSDPKKLRTLSVSEKGDE
jgi:hypothetical protein